jgi:uncharacterized protein (DUF1501 family)
MHSDMEVLAPGAQAKVLVDEYVRQRTQERLALAGVGNAQVRLTQALEGQRDLEELRNFGEIDLSGGQRFEDQMKLALDCFELGLAQTAMVSCEGFQRLGWDTHGANYMQSDHFNELFSGLSGLMAELDQRQSLSGGTLADEVVVVVFSEMGRFPKLNSRLGKEHWTSTSAILIGAGIAGGQVIGGYDSSVMGQPVDLGSGEVSGTGEKLQPAHLGATLFALADMDPAEQVEVSPISAAIA